MRDSRGNIHVATVVALLDTGAQGGNWISYDLLQRLNKLQSMRPLSPGAHVVRTGSGRLSAEGYIRELEWKLPRGPRYHLVDCYVCPQGQASDWYDIIFGSHYIVEKRLLKVNEDGFLPTFPEDDRAAEGEHRLHQRKKACR
jgi:hypothetical protein